MSIVTDSCKHATLATIQNLEDHTPINPQWIFDNSLSLPCVSHGYSIQHVLLQQGCSTIFSGLNANWLKH